MKSIESLVAAFKSNRLYEIEWGSDGVMAALNGPGGVIVSVIASWGGGWDHVSVVPLNVKRVPTWEEMCWVKDMLFLPNECVVQYHPAEANYINDHRHCLHLWRPQNGELPVPPKIFV
jgi:hypothetical protein